MTGGINDDRRRPATRVVQAGRRAEWTGAAANTPVWRASTMLYDSVADLHAGVAGNADGAFFYGRRGSPTQWSLAEALTTLEPGAAGTMLYPSGMAAVMGALFSVLGPGDELLMVDTVYEPTRRLCDQWLARHGVTTRYYDPMAGAGIADLIGPATRAIFIESPGTATFEVQDVPAIAAVARDRGIVMIADTTWATSLLFPAIAHRVDLVVQACTKYVVGHSDVMMGSVTATAALWPALRTTAQLLGQCVSPDDAYLASRGLRTMAVRLARHGESSTEVARWLDRHPGVARVLHPALPGTPGHDVFTRDFTGSAGLFAFTLSRGSVARVVDALTQFGIGYSFGGYESLALPMDPTRHRSATQWPSGSVIRLNIGLEDVADLIDDLSQALAKA